LDSINNFNVNYFFSFILSNNSKFFIAQGSQLTDSDDLKFQTNQNFAARSSFETASIPNKVINQGSRGWQPSQTVEQRQTLGVFIDNNSRY